MTTVPSSQAGAPPATTLDEAALRRVFPDAAASLDAPLDVGSLFRARMRGLGGARRSLLIAVGITTMLAGVVVAASAATVPGLVIAVAPLVVLAVVAFVQHGRASDDFFGGYAASRGLSHVEDSRVSAQVPLFGRGDKREWSRVLSGSVAGHDASVSLYTYTDVSTDSDGNRSETDYDFTCVHFRLPDAVAARFAGVYVSPRKLGFGKLQDALAHDRKVELESAEFAKRYTLRVVDSQDDIALRELFSTSFMQRMSTELQVAWEQRGADLVVWRKGHETEAADLDRMCLEAWHVLHRYLEEWR